jgi:kynurenine formamidase
VKQGKVFPLAIDLSADGPQIGVVPGRVNPIHLMTQVNTAYTADVQGVRVSDDAVTMGLQAGTHWDSLAHVSYDGRVYNGFGADVISEAGTSRLSIHNVKRLAGRGVLLDIARTKGVERLEPGYTIRMSDLDAAVETTRDRVLPGDIVLIRTGHIQLFAAGDRGGYAGSTPGPGLEAVRWFRANDIAAAATDTLAFEVFPGESDDLFLPVHMLDLVEMGMPQGQNFWLEDLAADCASDGQYTFLLEATPEPFVGAVGAPVAPVAIK